MTQRKVAYEDIIIDIDHWRSTLFLSCHGGNNIFMSDGCTYINENYIQRKQNQSIELIRHKFKTSDN